MSNRETPKINAGSMADIAFLLLIFFLVTTTLDADVGIPEMLSKEDTGISTVKEKNVLEITINANNEIQLESSQTILLEDLKQHVIDFIDNGASTDQNGNACTWCNGKKESASSDHPTKAIVALESSRNSSYTTYIATHNEINSAYIELRNNLANSLYGKSYYELIKELKKNQKNQTLKAKIDNIKEKYPIHISDKELIK